MKQPDGTLSGVSKSIDAWSFGCVLSVAATWIVLGFQGLRQYERLRQLSPANNTSSHPLDRFHNGIQVLPEVGKWHDYLRGHLRSSDTTTELVLELVETRLLQADPATRYNMKKLCEKLQDLSFLAEKKITHLEKHSRDTDPTVMKALSNIEEEAQIQKSSEPKLNLLQQPLLQVNPRERASMQINKEEMIRNKPLGQTAHRKEILEKKLEDCHVMKMVTEPLANGYAHFGAVTDSPTDSTRPRELQFGGRRAKPLNPQLRPLEQGQSRTGYDTPEGVGHNINFVPPATPPSSDRKHKSPSASAGLYDDNAIPLAFGPHTSLNQEKPNVQISTADSPSERYPTGFAQSDGASKLQFRSGHRELVFPKLQLPSSSVSRPEKTVSTAGSPPHTSEQSTSEDDVEAQSSPSPSYHPNRQSHDGTAPVVSNRRPMDSPFDEQGMNGPIFEAPETSRQVGTVEIFGPSITVSHPQDTKSPQDRPKTPESSDHVDEEQAVEKELVPNIQASTRSNDSLPRPLPESVLLLPYDICHRRKDLDEQVSKGFAKGLEKVKGSFGIETKARDASLAETFSDPRELVSLFQILSIPGSHVLDLCRR